MDVETASPLERSVSQHSVVSVKSQKSTTVRAGKRAKLNSQPSQPSSSASPTSPSDKSLTSFPSFSPDSPRETQQAFSPLAKKSSKKDIDNGPAATSPSLLLLPERTKSPEPPSQTTTPASGATSIVETLLTTALPEQPVGPRTALFEDAPLSTNKIPGVLNYADDEHIERLVARHGAVNLVRQIAEDLAQRDAQIAVLRRKADGRERALRKIILECGLSNMDLETRLRTIEQEAKANGQNKKVSDLVTDAMADNVIQDYGIGDISDATIRARTPSNADITARNMSRGWKDYIWGGAGRKSNSSRASSINGDIGKQTVVRTPAPDRRPTLQDDLFCPLETPHDVRSSSRASSIHSVTSGKSTSLASMALRLVAGGATTTAVRDGESRGRAITDNTGGSLRTPSTSSRSNAPARAVSTHVGPKALMAMRRTATAHNIPTVTAVRTQAQERWDTMGTSPSTDNAASKESYGPVEMDSILPPEDQPPTLTRLYNNYAGSEYLTDRFGFIYDQRRKKRQREAQQVAKQFKRGSRTEMLTANGSRAAMSPVSADDSASAKWDTASEDRPGTPSSTEEVRDESKTRRWQDYLKIATFPTELLSHTPSISAPKLEVMEGPEMPKSPSLVASDDRGFMPSASTTAAVSEEPAAISELEPASGTLVKEDVEPVRILLQQLSEVHDSLQREKTVRWNDFLRKVRAERRREGEAANASAAAAAEARFQKATAMMPESRLADGELIGVGNWANKGKSGRAKWNEFNRLMLGGIPVLIRSKIWFECSGAINLRVPGYYDDLVSQPEEEDNAEVVQQIRADINRTLTDNIFFRKGPGVQKLHEVLLAYARRNPEVGYCQGMNLIAANLLLTMPTAEDAFWILACIIEKILPSGYYDHSLLASRADQQVLRQYVAEVLPRLSQHFDELNIALETMTFQWFLSVFTDCLSAEALFRVWDVVLCFGDGSTFLFQVALALLKLNETQLLACDSAASVYTYINHQMTNHAISIDGLIQASEGLKRVVKREEVEARRERAIEAEKEQVRQREERLANYKKGQRAIQAAVAVEEEPAAAVSPIPKVKVEDLDEGESEPVTPAEDLTIITPLPMEE